MCFHPTEKNARIALTQRLLEAGNDCSGNSSSGGKARIFIVGVPRCGSTLIESILSINPLVVDLGETTALPQSVAGLNSTDNILLRRSLEELYLDKLNIPRAATEITIDKNLTNYMRVGIILRSMLAAKIIHCRRNPLDNILSMYRSNLTVGYNYTSSLEDSAEVLITQEQAMRYFKKIFLPVSIHLATSLWSMKLSIKFMN